MKDKIVYICGFCGTAYDEIHDRMNCEAACHKNKVEEERALAEAKKKEEQKVRKAEVDNAFENLHKLMTAYVADYGHYEYSDGGEDTNFYWPSKLWHRFW